MAERPGTGPEPRSDGDRSLFPFVLRLYWQGWSARTPLKAYIAGPQLVVGLGLVLFTARRLPR